MQDYELQEKQITDAMNKYRKNRDKELYRKINHQLDMYELYLDENFADRQKYDWLKDQKKQLNQLKQQKQLIGASKQSPPKSNNKINQGQLVPLNPNVGQQYTEQLRQEVNQALQGGEKGLQKAIQISNFIKISLDKQISQLDGVYQQNIKFENRMKRVKQGLNLILRQAFTNKLTRFFAILLLLAIIGVIVVTVLRGKGLIA